MSDTPKMVTEMVITQLERQLAEVKAERDALKEALKGTLYLFEAHAVTKTDLEQIAFARAAIDAARKP